MQRSDFHTRIYDFQTVILRLYVDEKGNKTKLTRWSEDRKLGK